MNSVLIVDDNREYLESLSRALRTAYEIVQALSLREAKEKMSDAVCLAVVDVRLSESDEANRDGLLLLEWLRENHPAVPVVMMSAYREFDSAVDSLNLGAAYYLKKPIRVSELKDVIESLTGPAES